MTTRTQAPPSRIAPGFVVSDRASARRLGRDAEDRRIAAQAMPVGRVDRVGRPEDITRTASYLVSPEAGFVSGQIIYDACADVVSDLECPGPP